MKNFSFIHVIIVVLLFFTLCIQADFVLVNNFNATASYDDRVKSLPQNCSDPENQVCIPGPNGVPENLDRIFITRGFCERTCGNGFGIWPHQDILLRVFLWVVPAIVLIAHFHFPPLQIVNYGAVVLHMLGDPIDSLWSMLVRIETCRYFYHLALRRHYRSYRAVATIWSAYDELGYQDASGHFIEAIGKIHQRQPGFLDDPTIVLRAPTLQREEAAASPGANPWTRLVAFFRGLGSRGEDEAVSLEASEEQRVLFLMERAAQHLVSNRSESALTSWFALFGLVSAIGGAYVRTWSERMNNQTAHTIATVTLLFVVIPIVKLSGNIGSFTSSTAAVDTIQTLREELGEGYALFPSFSFQNQDDKWAGLPRKDNGDDPDISITEETAEKLRMWPTIAAYSGMNCSWRPIKWKNTDDSPVPKRKSMALLAMSAFLVLICCYLPALLISYFTPLKGFSCRSLAWTLVASLWALSSISDWVFKSLRRYAKAQDLWRMAVKRDGLVTALISFLVICQQIGIFNSCYCRSGALSRVVPDYVNLTPLTDTEWDDGWRLWVPVPMTAFLFNLIFIVVVEVLYSDSRKLLNRSQSDREENLKRINRLSSSGAQAGQSNRRSKEQVVDGGGSGSHETEQRLPETQQRLPETENRLPNPEAVDS